MGRDRVLKSYSGYRSWPHRGESERSETLLRSVEDDVEQWEAILVILSCQARQREGAPVGSEFVNHAAIGLVQAAARARL